MRDKTLIKQRFERSTQTYDENAIIQKITAKKLVDLLPQKEYKNILEIGCYTGILTKELKKNIKFQKYSADDITEKSEKYLKEIIPESNFYTGDIEEIEIKDKYDLIISNASLQWCNDIEKTIKKLYNSLIPGGTVAISIFGAKNFREIRNVFKTKNPFPLPEKIKYPPGETEIFEEEIRLEFDSLTAILKHLRYTGVNALQHFKLTKSSLERYEELYRQMYSKNGKLYLTYNPVYSLIVKKN